MEDTHCREAHSPHYYASHLWVSIMSCPLLSLCLDTTSFAVQSLGPTRPTEDMVPTYHFWELIWNRMLWGHLEESQPISGGTDAQLGKFQPMSLEEAGKGQQDKFFSFPFTDGLF